MVFHFKSIGLWLGLALFLLVMVIQPIQLKPGSNEVLAVALWMITWWIFEAVPLAVTALLPIVLFSLLGVMSLDQVLVSYADKVLYLFFGGFVLALGLEAHDLHKRIALLIIGAVGLSAPRLLLGFLLATAFISMWISNTATAVMMLPMALSCLSLLYQDTDAEKSKSAENRNFAVALMLAIAYGSSIGGMATVIGTPPNLFMRRHFSEALNIEISFFHWMVWAVPIVLVLLAASFVLFAYVLFPCSRLALPRAEDVFRLEKDKLGPMRPVHWRMLGVFLVTALLWMSRGFIQPLLPNLPLTGKPIPLSDEAIAITAAISLFVIPGSTKGKKLLEWEATRKLPWGILLLFGGGIALAKALEQTGLLESLSTMVQQVAGDRPVLLIVLLTLLCLYLTEVMSNIALVQVMIPIVTSIAVGMKADPILFAFPATLAASCAFMLPMATPPNGIVFGSGKLSVWDMIKAGFWMNLVSLVVILLLSFWLVRWFPQN
jgi:solute carrier family 13 (sodium-dependent dicarboxylate transporter), member 2/3/5